MKTIKALFNEWFWLLEIIFTAIFDIWGVFVLWNLVTPDTWFGHWDFLQENSGIVYFTLFAYGFAICHFCNRLR